MSDRELLEMAALAAGYEGTVTEYANGHVEMGLRNHFNPHGGNVWLPLIDDGDEARLEATLGLSVNWYPAMVLVGPAVRGINAGTAHAEYFDKHNGDKQAARRLAGVRAAAAIGKAIKA